MAMSANAVLMKFFKLPPALRMVLALAGFGSLASILYTLLPALRTRRGQMWVLAILGGAVLIFGLIWLIRRAIVGKKSSQLSGALESQGPTRGDIAEQEQIYREKFRSKLAELKTNGLSVYKLPWFVLMGEPGCGKTASLIHSGLDFPLGKDEVPGFGGTRNYNWWFANEAVILDTAGRIAFHEEGTTDKVEWEYFCKLLKQNRPRCPINGIVVAIPADKLLRDSSEERAQKATVLRERLRQIHQLLGVRFPTFILVTKMDLVGGFNEFFEEIRVDLQQRNQMFGWSRPGEFQDSYDPNTFDEAFQSVYDRLRDWSMRYLQRKATEQELGMIVTFPESFRALQAGLGDYVKTVFQKSPLLEPPFFRGFYFTSAVQEGAPILDILTRSSTHHLTDKPSRAVDSKAFFIHDLYARKVFPEQGLVFRSAKHVSLNRRMRRLVWVGSGVMFALLCVLFFFGLTGTRQLITSPRANCAAAVAEIEQGDATLENLEANLALARELQSHYEAYDGAWLYARMLFIGADIDRPKEAVGSIHARFVLDCIVKPTLARVEQRLRDTELTLAMSAEQRQRHIAALAAYTQWYGEVVGQPPEPPLDAQEAKQRRAELEKMLRLAELGEQDFAAVGGQFETALQTLARQERAFARDVLGGSMAFATGQHRQAATDTIVAAIDRIGELWRPITRIDQANVNQDVQYWVGFANAVATLRERYAAILAVQNQFKDPAAYSDAAQRFLALTAETDRLNTDAPPETTGTLHEAFWQFRQFLLEHNPPETSAMRIKRLNDLLGDFKAQWTADFAPVEDALTKGAQDRDALPQQQVYAKLDATRDGLVASFEQSVAELRTRLEVAEGQEPLDLYADQKLIRVVEAPLGDSTFKGPPRIELDPTPFGPNDRVKHALLEMRDLASDRGDLERQLQDLSKWPDLLSETALADPPGTVLESWFKSVREAPAGEQREEVVRQRSLFAQYRFWKPLETYRLVDSIWAARRSATVDDVIASMVRIARGTTTAAEHPGLARLMQGYDQPAIELPFDKHRFNSTELAAAAPAPAPAEPQPEAQPPQPAEPADPVSGRIRRGGAPEPAAPAQPSAAPTARVGDRRVGDGAGKLLQKYHTRDFLSRTLQLFVQIKPRLQDATGGSEVVAALQEAADAYVERYFADWSGVYDDPRRLLDVETLTILEQCRAGELDWARFVRRLSEGDGAAIAQRLSERTQALIRHAIVFDDAFPDDALGNPALDLTLARLEALAARGKSLRHRFSGMAQAANRMPKNVDPGAEIAGPIGVEWAKYVSALKALGPLSDEKPTSSQPPDVAALRQNIVYLPATDTEFLTIAPLVELAGYGQRLLVHHLDQKLASAFAPFGGRFPLASGSQQTVSVRELIALLKQAQQFERTFAALYRELDPQSASLRTLEQCAKWITFLYADPAKLLAEAPPDPLDVRLTVVKPDPRAGFTNAAVYQKFALTLPLLTPQGDPAEPIVFDTSTRSGATEFEMSVEDALASSGKRFLWKLDSGPFRDTVVVVSDLYPGVNPALYDAQVSTWRLPGSPWSLLLLLSRADNSRGNGAWTIPVEIATRRGAEKVGFYVGVQLGNANRTFPGVISPPGAPGERPRMAAAQKFLGSPEIVGSR